jgi:AspT/YidE/YbjL antiporter-like protein
MVITRVWRDGKVNIPTSDTVLQEGDHLLVISSKNDVDILSTLFGEMEKKDWNKEGIDWNSIDNSKLVSRHVLVTKSNLNGVKLGTLKLRNNYGINITKINRAGISLLASPNIRLQLGDRLTVVGHEKAINNVSEILGNEEKVLQNPNLVAMFIGLAVGVLLGAIPLAIPGMSTPIKLGVAGGPIVVGILMGAFGPRFHLSTYTTRSANLMLRQFGIVVYLACLGFAAGGDFVQTVFRPEGLLWIGLSLVLSFVPVVAMGYVSAKFFKMSYAHVVGMLSGSMANPIALNYANSTVDDEEPSEAYATVYPLSMFVRVISAQMIMIILS